jgi:ubiquinone/menaquinone biosynthesis C-methylase UbiE
VLTPKSHLERLGFHFDSSVEDHVEWFSPKLNDEDRQILMDELPQALGDHLHGTPDEAGAWRRAADLVASNARVAAAYQSRDFDKLVRCGELVVGSLSDGQRILDLGCGTGHLTTWYASLMPNSEITGIDVSPRSIDLARTWAADLRLSNAQFEVMQLGRDSLPDGPFDAVVDTCTLHYVVSLDSVLDQVRSVLTRNGRFVTMPTYRTPEAVQRYSEQVQTHRFRLVDAAAASFADWREPSITFAALTFKPASARARAVWLDAVGLFDDAAFRDMVSGRQTELQQGQAPNCAESRGQRRGSATFCQRAFDDRLKPQDTAVQALRRPCWQRPGCHRNGA